MSNLIFDNNTLKTYTSSISNHTDDQINKKIINPNLLINADFRNYSTIVNQRGSDIYSNISYGYTIDWWRTAAAVTYVEISNTFQGVKVGTTTDGQAGTFMQFIEFPERLLGKTVTLSAQVTSSIGTTTIIGTGMLPVAFANEAVTIIRHPDNNSNIFLQLTDSGVLYVAVQIASGSYNILNIKLELGSVSTLANDPPQDYNTELLKCQRYYLLLANGTWNAIATVTALTSTTATGIIYFPTMMRIPPTLVYTGQLYVGQSVATSVISSNRTIETGNAVYITAETSNMNPGFTYILGPRDISSMVALDAQI